MARRREIPKREILPDPLYKSELLAKFINNLMLDGKKAVAEKSIYGALDELVKRASKRDQKEEEDGEGGKSGGQDVKARALSLFKEVLGNIRPSVEVKSRRVGGATYQVPVEVRDDRSMALGMRWLIEAARKRKEKGMMLRLAGEMLEALDNRGSAIKKREDTHRMAKANQAFAHFRWT